MMAKNILFTFENLDVWRCSKELVVAVYALVEKFPSFETYGLGNQLRRAIVSVPSNIAEGNGRTSVNEKIRFIEIAYSSLLEAYNQLSIAVDLNYITDEDLVLVKEKFARISKMLNALRMKLRKG